MPLLRAENMRQMSLCFISQQQFEFHPRYYIKCSHLLLLTGLCVEYVLLFSYLYAGIIIHSRIFC
jgi:hypothetical protein